MADAMKADGRLEEPWPGIVAQSDFRVYDRQTGLAVYVERLPVEDLVV